MKNKTKINKWDLIPLKSTGTAEETINLTKDNPPDGTIFANKNTHEEFLSKTYKQLVHLAIKETTQSNRGTRFKWTFLHRRQRDGPEAHESMLSICKY